MEEELIRRVQPQNLEAEKAVIGSMLMDAGAIEIVQGIVTAKDFYQSQYGLLFEAIMELSEAGKAVDALTLQAHLKEKGVPEELCSVELLRELLIAVPTSANVKYYAKIVSEKATLRRLIGVTEKISNACYLDNDSLENILESTEKNIFDILQSRDSAEEEPIRQVVMEALEKIDAASKMTGKITGIPSGFIDLDYRLSGLQPSDLILIAARPSMGKTSFALNIAQYIAFRKNIPTAIFSLEMSKIQLVNRLLSLEAMVDAQAIRNGDLTENDWAKLIEAAGVIAHSDLYIDDTPSISVRELRTKCRKLKLEKNLGVVMIDYLQLMSGNKSNESRQQEISDISRSLKALARELNVPVIALSQLSRSVEKRDDKHPILSDLRESGAIEQDADVVMFIHREEYHNHDTEKKGIAEINVAKQRNGPTGTIELKWMAEYTKFANLERKFDAK